MLERKGRDGDVLNVFQTVVPKGFVAAAPAGKRRSSTVPSVVGAQKVVRVLNCRGHLCAPLAPRTHNSIVIEGRDKAYDSALRRQILKGIL